MENNRKQQQPDFEGEVMKLPTQHPGTDESRQGLAAHLGTIITILFIILGLILAGLFYWYNTSKPIEAPAITTTRPTTEMNQEPESTTAYAQVDSFTVMSTSDEIEAIEADLESTNLDSLETELIQIEAELEASFQ